MLVSVADGEYLGAEVANHLAAGCYRAMSHSPGHIPKNNVLIINERMLLISKVTVYYNHPSALNLHFFNFVCNQDASVSIRLHPKSDVLLGSVISVQKKASFSYY